MDEQRLAQILNDLADRIADSADDVVNTDSSMASRDEKMAIISALSMVETSIRDTITDFMPGFYDTDV